MSQLDSEAQLDEPIRLDRVVARQFHLPRSVVQEALVRGRVSVNGSVERRASKLLRGLVSLSIAPPERVGGPTLVRIIDDPRFIVVDKPSGLLTHRVGQRPEASVVDALLAEGVPLAGGPVLRRGVVHRLDRETSGVLLLAKDLQSHAELSRQFKERDVRKTYFALVYGRLPSEEGIIDAPIASSRNPLRRIVLDVPGARPSQTSFRVLELLQGASLVELTPHTGRTHQIRAHLAAVGHPVLGDTLYGTLASRAIPTPRLMLHAHVLEFTHPSSRAPVRAEAVLPSVFSTSLAHLRPHG